MLASAPVVASALLVSVGLAAPASPQGDPDGRYQRDGEPWQFERERFRNTPGELRRLNDIAFSGDGEPTTCTEFAQVVRIAVQLREAHGAVLPGYHLARQPDNEHLRVWEIPGAAHADNYTIQVAPIDSGSAPHDAIVTAYAPTNMLMGQQLSHCINFAPQHHYVVQAAIARLHDWARNGRSAPNAPRMTLSEANPPKLILDENGLAHGGVRTPWVDVPVAKTSGIGNDDSVMSAIFGSGEVFDTAALRRLYPGGRAEYLERFTPALDQAIASGFIVAADRQEILELAAATYPQT